ncbi:MAG: SpoIVB peptidase [Bacilli bacterium]|nr:SpoIVB peptidase [Bacilli bacterium]
MQKRKKTSSLLLLLLTLFIIPFNVFAYSDYIIAGGQNIGIELKSNGVLIVGTYKIGENDPAKKANLQKGDKITHINGKEVHSIEEMLNVLELSPAKDEIKITYQRAEETKETTLQLIQDSESIYKTGLYVKDSINGIGTLTFIDPKTKLYGALGHEIIESTTGQKIEIKDGKIYHSMVTGINPSDRGNPGEKNAKYNISEVYGNIKENTKSGIFGIYTDELPNGKQYKVSNKKDITLGDASILTVISGNNVEEFKINILKVMQNEKSKKNILFEVTDERLLESAGGIVQGMSGSPIIQNNMIIGAVTHVVVDDCRKGYGIFIENMLEEAEN